MIIRSSLRHAAKLLSRDRMRKFQDKLSALSTDARGLMPTGSAWVNQALGCLRIEAHATPGTTPIHNLLVVPSLPSWPTPLSVSLLASLVSSSVSLLRWISAGALLAQRRVSFGGVHCVKVPLSRWQIVFSVIMAFLIVTPLVSTLELSSRSRATHPVRPERSTAQMAVLNRRLARVLSRQQARQLNVA